MGAVAVPSGDVVVVLDRAVGLLRDTARFADVVPGSGPDEADVWSLAADIVADLVENVRSGTSEVWRSAGGVVFIRTAAIEPVDGPGGVIATSRVLDDRARAD